jgi:transcriptional regulator with XRE-family HTH domain
MSTALARRLDEIKERTGISGREVAELMKTTPQTVSRWRQGRASPQPGSLAKLLKLDWLLDQLGTVYEPDEARLWLFSPNRELDGQTPAQMIANDRIEEVLAIIDRLRTGAYT